MDSLNKSTGNPYDITHGSDFMVVLGIDLSYSKIIIYWDGEALPMKDSGILTDLELYEAIYFAHSNALLLQDIEAR